MLGQEEHLKLRVGSNLEQVLASKRFAVTSEIAPPASPDPEEIRRTARLFKGYADACNVTDNQRALVKMSSLAAASIIIAEGLEPVMQIVSRDRNRIALQSDVLGAAAIGIRNVLCLKGDDPRSGNEKDAKPVYDLTTEEMISTFKKMREEGTLLGGERLEKRPEVLIGAAANPFAGSFEESVINLRGKVEAGADFIQTQAIYDVDGFADWMSLVRKEWLHERVYILAGIIPLKSPKMARFMAEKVPGIVVPEAVLDRISKASDAKATGIRIAVETIEALSGLEGVRGIHLMAVSWEEVVPHIVMEVGLYPRPKIH